MVFKRKSQNLKLLVDPVPLLEFKKNLVTNYCGSDTSTTCLEPDWWKTCPVQDFNYQFNSWGFRGPEYDQYLGKPVNICLGDSATVNIGGPVEHSWPSLLQKHYDIPCLNFGMEAAGNDAIKLVYDRACQIFDVKKTFVVYSFFHRRLENNIFISEPHNHVDNIAHFKKHFIKDAYYNFLPYWFYNEEELNYIGNLSQSYLSIEEQYWEDSIPRSFCLKKQYNILKGNDWPSYEDFILGATPHPDIYTTECRLLTYYLRNRDGVHLSLYANHKLADNLYEQSKLC